MIILLKLLQMLWFPLVLENISAVAISLQKANPYIFWTSINIIATAMLKPDKPTRAIAIFFLVVILIVATAKIASAPMRIYSDIISMFILTSLLCMVQMELSPQQYVEIWLLPLIYNFQSPDRLKESQESMLCYLQV